MDALAPAAAVLPLQSGPFLGTPLGKLLVAIVALAVIVFVGRLLLNLAWKLLLIAGVVVGVLYLVSLVAP
ncbi:MAG: hypothetical protein ABEJ04_04965 [Halobacteriaceae archaeon]